MWAAWTAFPTKMDGYSDKATFCTRTVVPCASTKGFMTHAIDPLNPRLPESEAAWVSSQKPPDSNMGSAQSEPPKLDGSGVFEHLSHQPDLSVRLTEPQDFTQLWQFEKRHSTEFNQVQWARSLQAQGLDSEEAFHASMLQSQRDAELDNAYHYLIWFGDTLIGSMKLINIQRGMHCTATLVWRIAPRFTNLEHKTRAVQQILNHAFYTHGITRLQSRVNTSSQDATQALLRNGFQLRAQQNLRGATRVYEILVPPSYETLLPATS